MQKRHCPHAGDLVCVRRRRWRVIDVRAHDACQVVTLAGIGAADVGVERRVIAPFDCIEPIAHQAHPRLVSRRIWRRACRTLIAKLTPPGALRSGPQARIDLLPHQLEPALAIAGGLGCRLLLADAVGLGKTIQAALVLSELRARSAIDRALILTPAGLRDQWARELSERVGIGADVIDARDTRRRVAALPVGVNPWSTTEVAIASFDYVKRPEILPVVGACRWDLLIVDEAHNVAGTSDRHDAIAALAGQAAYVLLLTATPHNGDRRAFLSLCALGDRGDPLLVFRRTRHAVRLGAGRHVHQLHVRPNAAERRMHALVARFTRAVRADHADGDAAAWLALVVLNKRALSSARSLESTIERRLATLSSSADDRARQLALPLPDPDGDADEADWPPDLTGLTLADPQRERAMLRELAAAAHLAAHSETKIAALVRFLRRVSEPVIVFTEYRDTVLHLLRGIRRPAALLHGGLTRDERAAALEGFVSGRQPILLTTDAAGEGLNLHHRCRTVVNLELPWNPMRLEQRIGRVDRIGQRRTVHAVHLIARDTGEARILERLRVRIAQAQADVGTADPLGASDAEHDAARVVIGGAASDEGPGHQPQPPLPDSRTVVVTLEAEARAEAARLADARRWMLGDDRQAATLVEGDGAWLTFARGAARAAFGGRLLLVFRAATEDAVGRLVDATLVPVAIEWPRSIFPIVDRRSVCAVVDAALPRARALVNASAAPWAESAAELTGRFFTARLWRERALASAIGGAPAGRFQPGLFDRRVEEQHRSARTAAMDAAVDRSRRLSLVEEARQVSARPPQLLLVLAP
jgi:superfamily II DNA or RNA helicase